MEFEQLVVLILGLTTPRDRNLELITNLKSIRANIFLGLFSNIRWRTKNEEDYLRNNVCYPLSILALISMRTKLRTSFSVKTSL